MLNRFPVCLSTLLALSSLISSSVFADAGSGEAGKQNSDKVADRAPLVILAPEGPVFAEIRISVDQQAYRLWVSRFLAKKTDIDNDGTLTLQELELIPARILQQTKARTAKRVLRQSTGSRTADRVPVSVFNDWLARELKRSFNVIAGSVQASGAVRLASLIDENHDGGVSRTELQAGARAMRFRDLDDDQTFSASELLPYQDPRNRQAALVPDVADLPFIQISDEDSIRRAAGQIVKRYSDTDSVAGKKLRLPADHNVADQYTVDDMIRFLQDPVFHLSMNFGLADRANASSLTFEVSEHATPFCRSEQLRRTRSRLIIDDMPIETRARGGGASTRTFLVSFLLQRVSIYDTDKSGYLSEDEFPQMQSQLAQQNITTDFESADLNNDGMLFRDELKMFIERDAIATQSRIEVSVRQDGKTLFKLLDTNIDRRLSQRELLEGFEVLKEYDVDSNDRLTESELGTAYILEIGLGQVDTLRRDSMMQNNNMGMQSTDAILPGVAGLEGPEWFRRMDRNQDRDVSSREFLGPRDLFEQLDTNKDGLLSAAEAELLQGS